MPQSLVDRAERLAEEILWPDAPKVDRAPSVPLEHLSALADAGLYGIEDAGLNAVERALIIELLASGCLSTAFVWIQHHRAVRAVMQTDNRALSEIWLADLLSGRKRAGIAIGGVRPPEPSLRVRRGARGWELFGSVPWVTGWGLVDVLLVGAVTTDGREVWSLVPASDTEGLTIDRYRLVAADASSTVRLTFDGYALSDDLVIASEPHRPPPANDGGGRSNGSLALGVARRACLLMGRSPIDDQLDRTRLRLDSATEDEMAAARAQASELALRGTARLAVVIGSRAVDSAGHAQRLAREAQFTAVFGTRPAIKAHLLGMFDRER